MYINKIDDLLSNIIDDFNNIVIKDKKFDKFTKEQNFVKYQKEMNDVLIQYSESINKKEIRDLVRNEDNVKTIINIIKRYICLYLFLMLGVFYTGKNDTYINNIIEFTKNQSMYLFRVDNFFNSENNALVIKYNELIKNMLTLINVDPAKLSNYANKTEFKETIMVLNTLGSEYIDQYLRLENLNGNVFDQAHNIIKTVIILLIYKKKEKEFVFRILESAEAATGEYIFIDRVMPKTQHIDFSTIETILTKKEILKGVAHAIWSFLTEEKTIEYT